ncbi:MAG: pilin [Parcubacteria group bacterium]
MSKLFSSFLLAIVTLSFFSVLLLPSLADAQVSTPEPGWKGIVPCGRNTGTAEEMAPCTLCHLVVGFQRLVQYGMYMVVSLALVGIFFAGVMYMVSTGDENMMTQAKGFLKVSLIGFAVVIGGWLIVNVTMWVLGAKTDLGVNAVAWNKFTCDTKSSQGTGGTTAP